MTQSITIHLPVETWVVKVRKSKSDWLKQEGTLIQRLKRCLWLSFSCAILADGFICRCLVMKRWLPAARGYILPDQIPEEISHSSYQFLLQKTRNCFQLECVIIPELLWSGGQLSSAEHLRSGGGRAPFHLPEGVIKRCCLCFSVTNSEQKSSLNFNSQPPKYIRPYSELSSCLPN